jgi:hypothetical protein
MELLEEFENIRYFKILIFIFDKWFMDSRLTIISG